MSDLKDTTPPKLNSDLAAATPQDDPDALAALCWEACSRIAELEEENASLKERTIVLPPEAYDRLMAALDNPPEPTEALKKLMRGVRKTWTK